MEIGKFQSTRSVAGIHPLKTEGQVPPRFHAFSSELLLSKGSGTRKEDCFSKTHNISTVPAQAFDHLEA